MTQPGDAVDDRFRRRAERMWAALVARCDAFDRHRSFLGTDVPPDRLEHATAKFVALQPGERLLAFLDETVTANGKGGIALTDRAIHTRQFGEGVHHQPLDAVRSVDIGGVLQPKLRVNGRDLVTSTLAQNRPALEAIRDAVAAGIGAAGADLSSLPPPPPVAPPPAAPAGWNPDPGGRHQLRYWDGARWTDDVADAGVASREPLAPAAPVVAAVPAPPPQATAPAPAGPVTVKVSQSGVWNVPAMCVVCGAPDIVGVARYAGDAWGGKYVAAMSFPLCAACHAVAVQGGLQPDGAWRHTRVPKELKPRLRQIQGAVQVKPPSSSFGAIRFTFANGAFGREFQDLNP